MPNLYTILVPARGLEPRTIGLKDRCSAKLSYAGSFRRLTEDFLAGGSERSLNSKPASKKAGFGVFGGP